MIRLNHAVDRATSMNHGASDREDNDLVTGSELIEACTGPLSRKLGELIINDLLEQDYSDRNGREGDGDSLTIDIFALTMDVGGKVLKAGVRKPTIAHPDGDNVRWVPEVSTHSISDQGLTYQHCIVLLRSTSSLSAR